MLSGPLSNQVRVYDQLADMFDMISKQARKSKRGVSKLRISGLNGGTTMRRVLESVKPHLAENYTIELIAWDPKVEHLDPNNSEISYPVFREIKRLQRALDSQDIYDPSLDYDSLSELACEYFMLGSNILATPGRQRVLLRQIDGILSTMFPTSEVSKKNGSILTRLTPHYVPGVIVVMDDQVFTRIYTFGGEDDISLMTSSKNKLYHLLNKHQSNIWTRATEIGARPIGRNAESEIQYLKTLKFPKADLPTARVFMNYRRTDTGWAASRLFDHLIARFGCGNVFLDHKTIPNATQFKDEIWHNLSESEVFLVFVGPDWATITNNNNKPRLFEADDLVRREIEAALKQKKHLLLVRVDGAIWPKISDLPESISALTKLHSDLTLSFETFSEDARKIANAIERLT